VHSQLGYMSPFVAKVTVEEFEARYEEERIRKAA
jgi:hypothetical protein